MKLEGIDESMMKDIFATDLNRNRSIEFAVHSLLHQASRHYDFHQVAYLDLEYASNNYVIAKILDGFGPVTAKEHEETRKRVSSMSPEDFLRAIRAPPIDHNPDFLRPIKGYTFPIDVNQDSILRRVIQGYSYWGDEPTDHFSEQDQRLLDIFNTDRFNAIAVKAKNEDQERVIGIVYGNKIFSDESFDTEDEIKERIRMYIEVAGAVIDTQKEIKNLIKGGAKDAIKQALSKVRHEIANPLTTIGGFARSIPRKYEDKERTIRNASIIAEEVRRLEGILTSTKDFTSDQKLEKSYFNLYDLTSEVLSVFTEGNKENEDIANLRYSNPQPGFYEDMVVFADKEKVYRVLLNLVKNAFEEINRSPGEDEENTVLGIGYNIRGDEMVVSTNNPQVIPANFQDKIFNPYFTTKGDKGTGLGLIISQEIAEANGGYLIFESNKRMGTTFYLGLPSK